MPALLNRLASASALGILVLGLTAAHAGARPVATSAATAASTGVNPGVRNYLFGAAALSASDAWAAGYYCTAGCASASEVDRTLIVHWDGTTWSQIPSPSPSTAVSRFYSVTVDSPADAWAAGYYCAAHCGTASEADRTLIAHWDGTTWTQVPTPNPSAAASQFRSVSADSPKDAWAAGFSCTLPCQGGASNQTLIAHWNGTTWSQVRSPNPGLGHAATFGVSTVSAADAWATGTYCVSACGTSSEADHMLMAHWNGTTWTTARSPNPSTIPVPQAVAAASATDAWVAGWYNTASASRALLLHWNGAAWSKVTSPMPGAILRGVSDSPAAGAWAVGNILRFPAGQFATVILHWNGTVWARVGSPSPSSQSNGLYGVSADSTTDAWAVGYYCASQCFNNSERDDALILHWNGTAWSRS